MPQKRSANWTGLLSWFVWSLLLLLLLLYDWSEFSPLPPSLDPDWGKEAVWRGVGQSVNVLDWILVIWCCHLDHLVLVPLKSFFLSVLNLHSTTSCFPLVNAIFSQLFDISVSQSKSLLPPTWQETAWKHRKHCFKVCDLPESFCTINTTQNGIPLRAKGC